jgi:hypothetical protein
MCGLIPTAQRRSPTLALATNVTVIGVGTRQPMGQLALQRGWLALKPTQGSDTFAWEKVWVPIPGVPVQTLTK